MKVHFLQKTKTQLAQNHLRRTKSKVFQMKVLLKQIARNRINQKEDQMEV